MEASSEFRNSQNVDSDSKDVRPPITVYRRRWWVTLVVVILNISNAALWITYAPVANYVSDFYQKYDGEVNWFSVVYLFVSIPFCFVSTFTVDKLGLKIAIHAGAALNTVGAVVKALGTAAFIGSKDAQFGISLTGQVIAAMAQPFLLFIPTKVSQVWFPENQRTVSTTILSMSNPLGIVVAQVVTPLLIRGASDVPLNNYVWMGVAIVGQVTTLAFIRSSNPPTPASYSSQQSQLSKMSYLQQLKTVFTCKAFYILFFVIGFGIAYLSAMATVTQQILCGLGYDNTFCGLTTALLILVGFVGSAVFGIYVDKTKRYLEVCKIAYGCAGVMGICMLEFYLQEGMGAAILIFSSLFGFFGVGGYPLGLELAVEATYPVEETISTAFIFLSGQLQGVVLIAIITGLASAENFSHSDIEVCTEGSSLTVPKDYTVSIIVVMTVLATLICILIFFLDTEYKRQNAEKMKQVKHIPRNDASNLTEVSFSPSDHPVTSNSDHPVTSNSDHPVTSNSDHPVTLSSDHPVPTLNSDHPVPTLNSDHTVPTSNSDQPVPT